MLDIIIDGQWGSTGKGRLAANLAGSNHYNAVMTDCGPNAGHTAQSGDVKIVTHLLPIASYLNNELPVYFGPGSVIDPPLLIEEIERARAKNVHIHPCAMVVQDWMRKQEVELLGHTGSTKRGTGAALAAKVMRDPNVYAMNNPELAPWVDGLSWRRWDDLWHNAKVLVETGQGFGLSLDRFEFAPLTTGRNVTVPAILDRLGFSRVPALRTWGVVRTFPIRVAGNSGNHYDDQKELDWEGLSLEPELTTTTKKIRRLFSWSWKQWMQFHRAVRPTFVLVSFLDYIPNDQRLDFLRVLSTTFSPDVTKLLVGLGPDVSKVIPYEPSQCWFQRFVIEFPTTAVSENLDRRREWVREIITRGETLRVS